MFFFRRRKQVDIKAANKKVDKIKRETHDAATKATKNTQQLNRLFQQNGITLNIHIAAGGKGGH